MNNIFTIFLSPILSYDTALFYSLKSPIRNIRYKIISIYDTVLFYSLKSPIQNCGLKIISIYYTASFYSLKSPIQKCMVRRKFIKSLFCDTLLLCVKVTGLNSFYVVFFLFINILFLNFICNLVDYFPIFLSRKCWLFRRFSVPGYFVNFLTSMDFSRFFCLIAK